MPRKRTFDYDLATWLVKNGLTQTEVARIFGVSQYAIARAINPERRALWAETRNAWARARRKPCLGGCGRLCWAERATRTGYCIHCVQSFAGIRPLAEHGTESCYGGGCRRPECRAAATAARRERRRRAGGGRGRRSVESTQ